MAVKLISTVRYFVPCILIFMLLTVAVTASETAIGNAPIALQGNFAPVQDPEVLQGSGTKEDPFIISDTDDFLYFAYQVNSGSSLYSNAYYKQTGDVIISDGLYNPVGTQQFPFCGDYDGDGNYTELNISDSNSQVAALFGYAENANFKNMQINVCIDVQNSTGEIVAAGLCGDYLADELGNTFEISKISVTGNVKSVSGESIAVSAGVVGRVHVQKGKLLFSDCVSHCSAYAEAKTTAYASGIASHVAADSTGVASFVRCAVTSEVSSKSGQYYHSFAGGIAGYFTQDPEGWSGWVSTKVFLAESSNYNLENCLAECTIESTASNPLFVHIGQIAAFVSEGVQINKNSLFYTAGTQMPDCSNAVNGTFTDKKQLFDTEFLFSVLGFDFENVWININGQRLELISQNGWLYKEITDNTALIQPVNCAAGNLVVSFVDENGRITDIKVFDYDPASNVLVKIDLTEYGSVSDLRTFLLQDGTLMPLARKIS